MSQLARRIRFWATSCRIEQRAAMSGLPLPSCRDTLEFAEALARLQDSQEFNRVAFERTLDAIRCSVAGRLWQLVVVQAELLQHLKALRDYYLMAKVRAGLGWAWAQHTLAMP